MSQTWLYGVLRPLAVPAFKAYFRLEVEGKEHVPTSGRVILASVHRSYLDTPMLGMLTWRQVHFMAKAELFERRFSRWFCESLGSFAVRRGARDRQALDAARHLLEGDGVLGLFPEGSRQEGPTVQEMHHGVAYLAQKTSAPVVPVAVVGSDRAMGPGDSFPKPKKIRVRAAAPLDLIMGDTSVGSRRAREQASEVLRSELQRLYDELRADA